MDPVYPSGRDTSSASGTIATLQHRFDYYIGDDLTYYGWHIPLGYYHDIHAQYIEDYGSFIIIRNGVEFAFGPTLTFNFAVPLYLEFPTYGDSEAYLGFNGGVDWNFHPRWALRLRAERYGEGLAHAMILFQF
ncbi:hypothetical protein KQI65_06940 [bacterium]|nr:hypothetical protein [bacterium]